LFEPVNLYLLCTNGYLKVYPLLENQYPEPILQIQYPCI
jgi:hypothetical protein